MASSLVPQRVKNTGVDLIIGAALIGGAVLLVGYGNKKFNILGKFVQGVTSIGSAIGQAVGSGVSSIPVGIGQGAASIFQTGGTQNNLSRASLGLIPDTDTCTHIPFTNIPFPGSKCAQDQNKLHPTSTSKTSDPNGQATSNTGTNGIPVDTSRSSQRSPIITPTQPGSNLITGTSGGKISSMVQTVPIGALIQSTPTSSPKPLNLTLQNLINSGQPVYSATISTVAGGLRQVTGSQGLIQRLAQNLGVSR